MTAIPTPHSLAGQTVKKVRTQTRMSGPKRLCGVSDRRNIEDRNLLGMRTGSRGKSSKIRGGPRDKGESPREAANLLAMGRLREAQKVLGMRAGRSCWNPDNSGDQIFLGTRAGRSGRNLNNRKNQKLFAIIVGQCCRNPNNREDQKLGFRARQSGRNPNNRENTQLFAIIVGKCCKNPSDREDQKLGFRVRQSGRNQSIKVVAEMEEVQVEVVRLQEEEVGPMKCDREAVQ